MRTRHATALIALWIIAAASIPVYGLLTGQLEEMIGGRMMVWGGAWLLILFTQLVIALIVVVRVARRGRRP